MPQSREKLQAFAGYPPLQPELLYRLENREKLYELFLLQSTSYCSERRTGAMLVAVDKFLIATIASRTLTAVKAQQEPHVP